MKRTIFRGAGVAIATPMFADGSIHYEELARLIDWQIENHTDAIIICGTTGESSTMTDDEHAECIRFAVEKVNHRVPVIAGAGSNDTAYAVWLSKEAKAAGARRPAACHSLLQQGFPSWVGPAFQHNCRCYRPTGDPL